MPPYATAPDPYSQPPLRLCSRAAKDRSRLRRMSRFQIVMILIPKAFISVMTLLSLSTFAQNFGAKMAHSMLASRPSRSQRADARSIH